MDRRPSKEFLRALLIFGLTLLVLSLVLFFIRSHLSVATSALVLVIPVVVGVVAGGFSVGVVGVLVGFVVYDYFFIPPFYTLNVGAASNWVALVVYVVVVGILARVVASLRSARAQAIRRSEDLERLAVIT
ncbi:MAG: DUF4118 domain-containing protein, partial [Acidimicrobiales bacterium]